ncbi:AtpZ/AtpI family protein [Heliobacterium chlorum]|uniref:AtpZ/AtpI family protein n=1 Tax=Heliobacterium chlorum TaxID=2698 RepID=A0ABR7T3C8_HELCL|nr:AtpZ/AtpI family protein [Heliobacterium chlorum]MBC9784523.1 AtpZ/AtpI family protein [Heliobacterium chlorum]
MANFELPSKRVLRAFALTSTIGAEFAAAVYIGYLAGRYADSVWGTDPWLMLTGVLVGVAGGFFGVYYLVATFFKEDKGKTTEDDLPE